MEIDGTLIAVFVVTQALQTAQIWGVAHSVRQLKRSIIPPPPPAAGHRISFRNGEPISFSAPLAAFCANCGNLNASSDLRHGMCPSCMGETAPPRRP